MIKRIATALALTAGTAVLATGCTVSFGKENPLKPADTPVAVDPPQTPEAQTEETPEAERTPSTRRTPSSTRTPASQRSRTPEPTTTQRPRTQGGAVPTITLEIKIANALEDQFGLYPTVECAEELPARVGAKVQCTADGTKLPGGHLNIEVEAKEVVGNQVNFSFRQV